MTFTHAEDAYIQYIGGILHDGNNHGDSTIIQTANNGIYDRYGLVKFADLFGTQSDQISIDTTVISADLHLWMSRESARFPNTINIVQLTQDWTEDTVTGKNYGSILTNSTGSVIASYYKASDNNATLPLELVFDVTDSVLSWQAGNGDTNFGWGIESQTLHGENYFYSSESAYQPVLVLNYAASPVPEPGTMFLFGVGLFGLAGVSRRK